MKKIFFILTILSITLQTLYGQITFKASAKKVVGVGETFRVSYTLNASGEKFKRPAFKNFDVLSGPNHSMSSQVQISNGKMKRSTTNTYSFHLVAKKKGKFTIPPAKITVDGKTYTSNSVAIQVLRGSNQSSEAANNNTNLSNMPNEDLFVRVNLNKTNVYQGEHILATIKVYSRTNLVNIGKIDYPSFEGFYSVDVENPSRISLERENVNGQAYDVGLFKKVLLFPQRSGELNVSPFTLECIVRVRTNQRTFFGYVTRDVSRTIKSPARKITVKPLPPNKPDNFSGAVGRFELRSDIDHTEVKTNDAISLKITLTGNGNLKLLDVPEINFPPSFETYDPKVTSNIQNVTSGSVGSKTYEYLIVPRDAGNFRIPPVSVSYFDLESETYKTIRSQEYNIKVERGSGSDSGANAAIQAYRKEEVDQLSSDIRHIKTGDITLEKKGETLFGKPVFYLAYIIPLLLGSILFVMYRIYRKQKQNISLMKTRQANRISKKRLKKAAQYMKKEEKEAFFMEVSKALWGYLSDKLTISTSELSRDNVSEAFQKNNVNKETQEEFIQVLDNCEFARYAPSAENAQMDKIYNQASHIIGKLENEIK